MTFWHLWVRKDPYKSNQQFKLTVIIWLDMHFKRPVSMGEAFYSDPVEERSWGNY